VQYLQVSYEVSERRARGVLDFSRGGHRYRSTADGRFELRGRLRELAGARPSYGYRRLWLLLRREGWVTLPPGNRGPALEVALHRRLR
jgi:putative transposase